MIPHKQLKLADIFEDCKNIFEEDKPQFLSLLEEHINLSDYIPLEFYNHFYASTGRSRKYSLTSLLWAVILQKIFSIPTDQLLLVFLHYSQHLRDFCGFKKVPDASKITRFKQDFENDIENVFHNLVDITEPICKAIDSEKADMLLFDTSGIEAWCHASNYSSHLRQLYRRLNPTSPLYHLSQRAVFYGTFLSALLTIPILSHIVFS